MHKPVSNMADSLELLFCELFLAFHIYNRMPMYVICQEI